MRNSLIVRASVLYFVLLISNITVMIVMVFENQVDLIAQNALVNSRLLGLRFREAFHDADIEEPDPELLRSFNVTSFRVYDENGVGVSDRYGDVSQISDEERVREIHTALTRRNFENRLFHNVMDYEGRSLDLYIPVSGDRVIVATVGLPEIDRQIAYLYRQALVLGSVVLVLHLLYASFLWLTVARPMGRIAEATSEVARGNFDVRIQISERNELGNLASAFNEMSVAVAQMQTEAKSSNPLTGLPGNPVIAATLERRITEPIAVLYIDLDNFKAFNDHYGFSRGDEAILLAGETIARAIAAYDDVFFGHQGGDDFVVVSRRGDGIPIAEAIIESFEAQKSPLIDDSDLKRGYIVAHGRNGKSARFPLVAISIAIVTNEHRTFEHIGEVASVAAEVKREAKKSATSSWAIDRRAATQSKAGT